MRLLGKRKNQGHQLFLKINANRAADLVTVDDLAKRKHVNPVLVALLNNVNKKTIKKLHTSNPSWDDHVLLPLQPNDNSQLLVLTVWDKHKRHKTYLGEARFQVSDLFYKGGEFVPSTDVRWYNLYSSLDHQSFVTGSLLVSFELVVKKRRRATPEPPTDVIVNVVPPSRSNTGLDSPLSGDGSSGNDLFGTSLAAKLDKVNLSSVELPAPETERHLQAWVDSLLSPDPPRGMLVPNEQGFFPSNESGGGVADISDIESLDRVSIKSGRHQQPLDILHQNQVDSYSDHLTVEDNLSTSDVSALSSDAGDDSDDKQKRRHFYKKKDHGKFSVANRKVLGVLFLEVVSCSDLPPMSNITRTSFDMDPFVVVAFGKKTFRTSWKRHTLNPIFNERLAFEVMSHEVNYNIQFSILDKDHFSFHDDVAHKSIRMKDLKELAGDDDKVKVAIPGVRVLEDNTVQLQKGKLRKRVVTSYADTLNFRTLHVDLDLHSSKYKGKYLPELKIRARFQAYDDLRRQFWRFLLEQYSLNDSDNYDFFELILLLDTLGCNNSDEIGQHFFSTHDKSVWGGGELSIDEIVDSLEAHVQSLHRPEDKLFEFERCPLCCKKRLDKKQDLDIITHFAICASKDWSIVNKLLVSSYVTPQAATKRWFTKVLIKLTYGKYQLGSNSANILVQDRLTGIVLEEKMGVYVRLGIRLLYKAFDKAKTKRVRILLKKLSIKQGVKFDLPQLAQDIESFIRFHKLDLSECLVSDPSKYNTFNEFFYRKLRPGARPNESDDPRVVVSPADCRCTTFNTVDRATELWIKGRNFTVAKLLNGNFSHEDSDIFRPEKCSLGIFRLAPQDYHRFHSPVDGTIKQIKYIEGEYYTVNPMAIRSDLDVFGENVRVVLDIETEHFGTVIMVAVGAMMVGSTILTVKEGDNIQRGDEVGYFKFGGSTVVLLFERRLFMFDSDIVENSEGCIETLVRVGQSIGHSPDIQQLERQQIDFDKQSKQFKMNLIRVITGGDLDDGDFSNWESKKVTRELDELNDLDETIGSI